MKRKFSFKITPIKVPTANDEEYTMDGVDSPPFSPVSFSIERPRLSPETYLELQQSCATIVQESQPVDHHVYEAIAATNKIPRKWSDDNQAYKSATQNHNPKPKTHRRTDSATILAPKAPPPPPANRPTASKSSTQQPSQPHPAIAQSPKPCQTRPATPSPTSAPT
ncbi:MAG: hypothetical protein LQ347_003657 [Umbilicaria vellea]|nr:MAG: hypothetical protein LQ347_003657 [Umbilicaria vellea]